MFNNFKKDVFKVLNANIISSFISIISIVFISRFFLDSVVGFWAIALSIVSVLAIISNARLDMAMLGVDNNEERNDLARIIISLTLTLMLVLAIFYFLLTFFLKDLFVYVGIYNYFFCSFLVILLSLKSTFGYWLLGEKKFSKYGTMNIIRSFTFLSMILVFGIFKGIQWQVNELILISVISEFIGLMSVIRHIPLKGVYDIRKYKTAHLSKIKLYKDYWSWGTLSDLINMLVKQLPIFTIMSIGGTSAVGQYSMALRIISAPNAVISKAIGDVYVQRASEEYIGQKKCSNSFGVALVALVIAGVPIYLVLYYFSPELMRIALGESWVDAGKIAKPLSILMLGAFIASTLGRTLQVIKKQKVDFFWQFTLILSIAFVSIYSAYKEHTMLEFVWSYVLIYMILYVALLFISGFLSKNKKLRFV